MKTTILFACLGVMTMPVIGYADVTLSIGAGKLYGTSTSAICANGSLIQLVSAGVDGSFAPPSASSFVTGDDVLLGSYSMDSTTTGIDGAISFSALLNYANLGVVPGQRVALRWFPSLSLSATAPGPSVAYGQYWSSSVVDGSDAWTLPSDGATANLYFMTLSVGGTNAESTGVASLLTATAVAPTITVQPQGVRAVAGQPASIGVTATGATGYQWYKGGATVVGATGATLTFSTIASSNAGIYDCVVSSSGGNALSAPVIVGVQPAAGQRTAGAVSTYQLDIHHPNGNIYDQFFLSGAAGTFTAATGKIARCSFLDENDSIVQVEMSGSGAISVVLDNATGPAAPALYNQPTIQYMKGKATLILSGADTSTHFTIYSVGTFTNPGATYPNTPYWGWADVAVAGIISTDGKLGGIHQGNVWYKSATGYTGIYAPTVTSAASLLVLHTIEATGTAQPYLYFGTGGTASFKIAGSNLVQTNGDSITVNGISHITMGAGQDSCGTAVPGLAIVGRLANDAGADVTSSLVSGP